MAIKPILFNKQISTEMVRAILDERKTCTHRVIKPQPEEKQIEERCSNCLYCGSNGVTCANANNSGKPMVFVNGGRACKWYWLNQNKYRRI